MQQLPMTRTRARRNAAKVSYHRAPPDIRGAECCRVRVVVTCCALFLACVVYGTNLGWGTPDAGLHSILFSSASLDAAYAGLAASKDAVAYGAGVAPGSWWSSRLSVGGKSVPAHILLQMRGFLLKTRTYDEGKTLTAVSSLDPRRFDPHVFIYGGAYLGTVGGALMLGDMFGAAELVPDRTFYLANPDAMGRLYLIARLPSAVAAVAIVVYCTWLATAYAVSAGILTAALLLISPDLLAASHVAKPHALAALLAFVAISLAAAPGRRWIFLGATLAGAAAATAVVYVVVPVALCVAVLKRGQPRLAAAAAALAATVFAMSNPHVFLFLPRFLETLADHVGEYRYGIPTVAHAGTFLRELIATGVGPAGLLLGLVGIVTAPANVRVVGWIGIAVVAVAASTIGQLRIVLVAVPVGALFAGIGGAWLLHRAGGVAQRTLIVLAVVGLQLATVERWLGLAQAFRLDAGHGSTATRAGRWINQNLPAGSTVAVEDSSEWTDNVPPFEFLKYQLQPALRDDTEYMVVSAKCPRDLDAKLQPLERSGFEMLSRFSGCLDVGPLEFCNCNYQVNPEVAILQRASRVNQ